ncbi:hypothetical protein [Lactiplantibacillus plantarum]|nr:hypothetical protein [Lactiplantibacillus plantarum]MBS0937072.1 hypothetical protein [Lactiplantibacillus plantarum]MBS0944125.1 hypothetical protein [Lactiplantibacillus plantarum]
MKKDQFVQLLRMAVKLLLLVLLILTITFGTALIILLGILIYSGGL